jgi:hypothetical protein
MAYTVYCHENKKNGKLYFGITKTSVRRRWSKGKGYKDQRLFGRAIEKYGWDGFEHIILFTGLTEDEAKQMERDLIREFHTQDRDKGYNITDGGDAYPVMCGEQSPVAKSVIVFNLDGTFNARFSTLTDAARYLGVNGGTLSSAISRKGTVKGYFCMFEDECDNREKQPPRKEGDMSAKCKAVSQYDADGTYIQSFKSIVEAAEKTGIKKTDISAAISGRQHVAHGFQFRYDCGSHENIERALIRGDLTKGSQHYSARRVQLYNANTGETIREYDCITEASERESVPYSRILSDCKHKYNTTREFRWRYAD